LNKRRGRRRGGEREIGREEVKGGREGWGEGKPSRILVGL
jgi:hypothetical protein